jgi:hypothetical protein
LNFLAPKNETLATFNSNSGIARSFRLASVTHPITHPQHTACRSQRCQPSLSKTAACADKHTTDSVPQPGPAPLYALARPGVKGITHPHMAIQGRFAMKLVDRFPRHHFGRRQPGTDIDVPRFLQQFRCCRHRESLHGEGVRSPSVGAVQRAPFSAARKDVAGHRVSTSDGCDPKGGPEIVTRSKGSQLAAGLRWRRAGKRSPAEQDLRDFRPVREVDCQISVGRPSGLALARPDAAR